MALTILQTVKLIAPEMADELEDDDINSFIELAKQQSNFGNADIKRQARAYLAAHLYTMSRRNGNAGGVATIKEGNLTLKYFKPEGNSNPLLSTSYGAVYLRLQREHLIKPRTKIVGNVNVPS